MALRPCLTCGALSNGTRCEPHRKAEANARSARRGTTAERGLSGPHASMSRYYKTIGATCACDDCGQHHGTCGRYGTVANPITAGHILTRAKGGTSDPANYRPECRSCNARRGALGLG